MMFTTEEKEWMLLCEEEEKALCESGKELKFIVTDCQDEDEKWEMNEKELREFVNELFWNDEDVQCFFEQSLYDTVQASKACDYWVDIIEVEEKEC